MEKKSPRTPYVSQLIQALPFVITSIFRTTLAVVRVGGGTRNLSGQISRTIAARRIGEYDIHERFHASRRVVEVITDRTSPNHS